MVMGLGLGCTIGFFLGLKFLTRQWQKFLTWIVLKKGAFQCWYYDEGIDADDDENILDKLAVANKKFDIVVGETFDANTNKLEKTGRESSSESLQIVVTGSKVDTAMKTTSVDELYATKIDVSSVENSPETLVKSQLFRDEKTVTFNNPHIKGAHITNETEDDTKLPVTYVNATYRKTPFVSDTEAISIRAKTRRKRKARRNRINYKGAAFFSYSMYLLTMLLFMHYVLNDSAGIWRERIAKRVRFEMWRDRLLQNLEKEYFTLSVGKIGQEKQHLLDDFTTKTSASVFYLMVDRMNPSDEERSKAKFLEQQLTQYIIENREFRQGFIYDQSFIEQEHKKFQKKSVKDGGSQNRRNASWAEYLASSDKHKQDATEREKLRAVQAQMRPAFVFGDVTGVSPKEKRYARPDFSHSIKVLQKHARHSEFGLYKSELSVKDALDWDTAGLSKTILADRVENERYAVVAFAVTETMTDFYRKEVHNERTKTDLLVLPEDLSYFGTSDELEGLDAKRLNQKDSHLYDVRIQAGYFGARDPVLDLNYESRENQEAVDKLRGETSFFSFSPIAYKMAGPRAHGFWDEGGFYCDGTNDADKSFQEMVKSEVSKQNRFSANNCNSSNSSEMNYAPPHQDNGIIGGLYRYDISQGGSDSIVVNEKIEGDLVIDFMHVNRNYDGKKVDSGYRTKVALGHKL